MVDLYMHIQNQNDRISELSSELAGARDALDAERTKVSGLVIDVLAAKALARDAEMDADIQRDKAAKFRDMCVALVESGPCADRCDLVDDCARCKALLAGRALIARVAL